MRNASVHGSRQRTHVPVAGNNFDIIEYNFIYKFIMSDRYLYRNSESYQQQQQYNEVAS